ncbi:WD40 repeat-like protein [Auriscalpium vulgare]|uniref:WD40 repeat-like protein n=1 Tax=Auriscalpium vulgare TaxID=40419 RepID=A0ACB8RLH2_9AGAM|nr:WD40 repeat-like protein [Auriscalpium vulgare]
MGILYSLRQLRFTPGPQQRDAPSSQPSPPLLRPASPVDPPTDFETRPATVTGETPHGGPISSGRASGTQVNCKCAPHPKGQGGRNLVVCIDGTANQFSEKNTNVVELYSCLDKDAEQLTYYDSAIGTYVNDSKWSPSYWKQVASNTIDMAIAWNFKRIILSAYQWLSENYQEGDKIFLFGFSRGAYQVRVIAGMIEKVGLLHKGNNNQIPFAYELYVSTTSRQKRADKKAPTQSKTKPGKNTKTIKKEEALCNRFKQTLCRADVRVHFVGTWDPVSSIGFARGPSLPETTTGMTHVCVHRHALALNQKRWKFQPEYANGPPVGVDAQGDVKEVWFVGSHSDIEPGRVSLATAQNAGDALFGALLLEHSQDNSAQRHQNINILATAITAVGSRPPASIEYSGPQPQELVSVLAHAPAAADVYKDFVKMFRQIRVCRVRKDEASLAAFYPDGKRIDEANSVAFSPDGKRIVSGWRDTMVRIWDAEAGEMVAGPFMGHTKCVESVAFSPDGKCVASGSGDQTIRIWDAQTGESVAGPFTGHTHWVSSVAFSPNGKRIVSGSWDETIRIWDVQTGQTVAGPFVHTWWVLSVAFSPDGTRVASGSSDETIRIWDPQTGEMVAGPLTGHTHLVQSVAFSPDGKRVISGSDDATIRIWDAQTGQMVAGPFTGHTESVQSVVFSPNGKYVVSSSHDETIRIWDARTGDTILGPFAGHTNWVLSVAYSPNGRFVTSGSRDGTIRIWDAEVLDEVHDH